jgi:prepilin-type N-terminal cleavage/methylation domain-containing protein
MNNKGYSMVELLIAIVISAAILGAIVLSYTGTLRVFKDVKSISDNIQTKTPSIELIARYFDRWGIGVVSKEQLINCDLCPSHRKTIIIKETNGCSDITFYGNIYGFGFVVGPDPIAYPANILSCRLSNSDSHNCYILWRDNFPQNEVENGRLIPLEATDLNDKDKECLTLSPGTGGNTTINSNLKDKKGQTKTIKAGDSLQRFPHKIRLYCNSNPSDNNRRWLYVALEDTALECNVNEPSTPIAPVGDFKVTAFPSNCDQEKGECKYIKVDIAFRSQSERFGGQYDVYKVTKVFGR